MPHLLDLLADRVLLADGAIGSRVQASDLSIIDDFFGKENCTEILNLSRPEFVRDLHLGYLAAGADILKTNSFGASPVTLGEFGLSDRAHQLNRIAAELAHEAIAEFKGDGRARFVFGSVGPGTKLPSLGHIDYRSLEESYAVQVAGLIAGGIDAVLIETCQDTLQLKAAVNGARDAIGVRDIPIIAHVTVEATGTLLVGADIAAAATIARALRVDMLGLNCATGPQEMAEHIRWLGRHYAGRISCMPNAGLPELVDGRACYPLSPEEFGNWMRRFVEEDGLNLIGGCCGTTDRHIRALDRMLADRADGTRPVPVRRSVHAVPSLASLFGQVELRQENATFIIAERCNATGSKNFHDREAAQDWEGCVALAREAAEGAQAVDFCTAMVGGDERRAMVEIVERAQRVVSVPLSFDSTETAVLEAALAAYGGKGILNSIHFEAGESEAGKRLELARRYGAAVIALTIEEQGMAKTADRKMIIARRLYDFACGKYGLDPADLMIDPLTFTIATGNEEDRALGVETLDAIERIRADLPECQVVLGLSNISFGLKPQARHVLNSVFFDHAVERGMTAAIIHHSRILPLHKIGPEEVRVAEDVIFDRRRPGYDPLQTFLGLFEGRGIEKAEKAPPPATVEERLKRRIVDGDRQGLESDLDEARQNRPPLAIINDILLGGMKTVGELFGAGKMQLPFVLQSAETMKAAVAYLEPFMERVEGTHKGTIVLATVRGDVHDIGKNLVDIILTNNGYNVVNLGIKRPLAEILSAARAHRADAIGMSGLLVKSTQVMRENLEEMARENWNLPVLLGGAALTRAYVEKDCTQAYRTGPVAYARDAFEGLHLMDKVRGAEFAAFADQRARSWAAAEAPGRAAGIPGEAPPPAGPLLRNEPPAAVESGQPVNGTALRPAGVRAAALRRSAIEPAAIPLPPFWGARAIERVQLKALIAYLNETMLFQFHWGYRKQGRTLAEFRAFAARELRPMLERLIRTCEDESILRPQAVYGYWKCAGEGNDMVIFEKDGKRELTRFALPRQNREDGVCIADFLRPIDDPERDVVGLQVVTVGRRASDVAREWFAENRYRDYVFLHGLGVEMAEAMAEFVHHRIRVELDIAGEDARDRIALLKQGYRGSRYSFGYPACPNLADQRALLDLLDAGRIGVSISEEDQLDPEQSTSAIVVHHPQAKYFAV